jgi:hypothetical protein
MPRITYGERFKSLLDKDYLIDRDRVFIESMHRYYMGRKSLTTGRRTHFLRLEKKYEVAPATDKETIARLSTLIGHFETYNDSSSVDFLKSLRSQARSGKILSERQLAIVESKEREASPRNLEQHKRWLENWNKGDDASILRKESYRIMIQYYDRTGYYSKAVAAYKFDPNHIPSHAVYKTITTNKYAIKILKGWFGPAKFLRGNLVTPTMYGDIGPCMVIADNWTAPRSACKGNKIYRIMSVQTRKMMLIEERHLRHPRKSKKKK